MCRNSGLFLLQKPKRSTSGDSRDFKNMETSVVTRFFFLQCKTPNEIHTILTETLRKYAPSYNTVKNCVAQFKRGGFYTCNAPRPRRTKTVTIPVIIDQIHEVILEDRRISAKSIAEHLSVSREWVGPSFMKIWTCGNSPRSGSRNI